MATVLERGQNAGTHLCAMNAFTQPTPYAMVRGYTLRDNAVETHIPGPTGTPTKNVTDNNPHPFNFTSFWLPSVPRTV